MKKVKITLLIFLTLFSSLFFIVLYLLNTNNHYEEKLKLVSSIGLSDLSISTEANYIRHRSLATIFDIYKDDPDIRVYFPSTFTINEGLHEK